MLLGLYVGADQDGGTYDDDKMAYGGDHATGFLWEPKLDADLENIWKVAYGGKQVSA
jgi:hypothetical protein